MNIIKNTVMFLLVAVAAIQFGCKGKQGDPGPQGPNDTSVGLFTNGSFIKGTVTTSLSDATPVSFSFNDTYLEFNNEYRGSGSTTWLWAYKNFKGYNAEDWGQIGMVLDSISDPTPKSTVFYGTAQVPVANNQTFSFKMYSAPATITNYSFNAATNTITGDYTAAGTGFNGQSATVTGSFKFVGLTEIVYRQGVK